jgi:hypothetical protein
MPESQSDYLSFIPTQTGLSMRESGKVNKAKTASAEATDEEDTARFSSSVGSGDEEDWAVAVAVAKLRP